MSENGITRYCLGNGDLKCDGCQQEKNWQTLNKMPDTLRKSLQATRRSGLTTPTASRTYPGGRRDGMWAP